MRNSSRMKKVKDKSVSVIKAVAEAYLKSSPSPFRNPSR